MARTKQTAKKSSSPLTRNLISKKVNTTAPASGSGRRTKNRLSMLATKPDPSLLRKDDYIELLEGYRYGTLYFVDGHKELKAGTVLHFSGKLLEGANGEGDLIFNIPKNYTLEPTSIEHRTSKLTFFNQYLGLDNFTLDSIHNVFLNNRYFPKFKLSSKDAYYKFWSDLNNHILPCTENSIGEKDQECEYGKVDLLTNECLKKDVIINLHRKTEKPFGECYNISTYEKIRDTNNLDPMTRQPFYPMKVGLELIKDLLSHSTSDK